jgi:superfamily II helicase
MKESLTPVPFERHVITLKSRNGKFQWIRSDGKSVSPEFETQEAANYFGVNVPFLTNEEWIELHPIESP